MFVGCRKIAIKQTRAGIWHGFYETGYCNTIGIVGVKANFMFVVLSCPLIFLRFYAF
jgi:hypothetical protein